MSKKTKDDIYCRYAKLSGHILGAIRQHKLTSVITAERYVNCHVCDIYEMQINRDEKIQEAIEINVMAKYCGVMVDIE